MQNPMKKRLAQAALSGALAGIQLEYPMHRVEVITRSALQLQVRIDHPTAEAGPRYFLIKVSEPT